MMNKTITDTERLDFLSNQKWTRWIGYDHLRGNGHYMWPVYGQKDIRAEIDRAIENQQRLNAK